MSTLGSLSGQLEREEERLRELNLALIALEANLLGDQLTLACREKTLKKVARCWPTLLFVFVRH